MIRPGNIQTDVSCPPEARQGGSPLAKRLWHLGFRYRLNDKRLPGSPDIAVLRYNIAIFVDGEFWHGQNWEERKPKLKRNREYWIAKIEENIARDIRDDKALRAQDWYVIHFWEKEVLKDTDGCISSIRELVESRRKNGWTCESMVVWHKVTNWKS